MRSLFIQLVYYVMIANDIVANDNDGDEGEEEEERC
jgi:hypothetical protein